MTTCRAACILATILATAGVLPAAQDDALSVVVRLPSGTPLAGARVSVIGRAGSVVADGQGRCTLEPRPSPPFVLFVARPDGVALAPVSVAQLPEDGPLEVTVAAVEGTVTVVSGVVPDLELPPAVAATVIGRVDLVQRQPQTLTDVLESVPGTTRGGEGRSVVPGIRGLPKHRTLILLDDGRVAAERRAGPSATFLDPETLDEVEVVRGPGSVAYGSDAFGGIIRARSRLPDPDITELSTRYSLRLGSTGDERGALADVSLPALGGGLLVGAQIREADDYSSPRGEVFNTAWSTRGYRLAWQGVVGTGVLHAAWRTDMARDVGKPAPDSRQVRVVYPEEDSHRFNLGFESPGPGRWSRLAASIAWDDTRLVLDKQRAPSATEAGRVTRSEVDAQDYELRLEAERPLAGWRLVVGANVSGRFNLEARETELVPGSCCGLDVASSELSIEDARRDDVGLFAAAGRSLGRFTVDVGVRGDRVRSENQGGFFGDRSSASSAVSGFAAAGVDLHPDVRLTYQVARGFRDALLSDRYYRGPTGRGFITGNPDLEPETSLQHDVSLRWQRGAGQLAAYAYVYRIDDLIERYSTEDGYFFRNRGSAELEGVELEGTLGLRSWLELQVGAQWARGEVRDDGTPLDDVPSLGGFVVLRADPSGPWWWMVRGSAWAEDDRPGPSEQVVGAFGLLDAAVGLRVSRRLRLELLGRNLLDETYLGSPDEDAVLAPGRSVTLSMRGVL